MRPTFFPTPADFREWLSQNHQKEKELLVGFYKVGTGKPSISWSESVDEAICFGWIDGVRKSFDRESYTIRFTPRKPTSIWSAINIKKVEELTARGLMHPAGQEAYAKRNEKKSAIYSYEKEASQLTKEYLKQFKANKRAWVYWQSCPAGYCKQMTHRVMDAKQEATRISRLGKLIDACAEGRRLT